MPVVRAGGLRVVVAANSFALPPPADRRSCPQTTTAPPARSMDRAGGAVVHVQKPTPAPIGEDRSGRCRIGPAAPYSPTGWPRQYHPRSGFSLPSSGWDRVDPPRHSHRPQKEAGSRMGSCVTSEESRSFPRVPDRWTSHWCVKHHNGPAKPHGPLVRLGCSARAPCTCRLSTWWSPTALQGDLVPGKIHLWRGFPLRCFQRLSRPDIATRHCHWHDNRYTRGRSVPVLSY